MGDRIGHGFRPDRGPNITAHPCLLFPRLKIVAHIVIAVRQTFHRVNYSVVPLRGRDIRRTEPTKESGPSVVRTH